MHTAAVTAAVSFVVEGLPELLLLATAGAAPAHRPPACLVCHCTLSKNKSGGIDINVHQLKSMSV
jgi:hypothetical protein